MLPTYHTVYRGQKLVTSGIQYPLVLITRIIRTINFFLTNYYNENDEFPCKVNSILNK